MAAVLRTVSASAASAAIRRIGQIKTKTEDDEIELAGGREHDAVLA